MFDKMLHRELASCGLLCCWVLSLIIPDAATLNNTALIIVNLFWMWGE